MARLFVANIDLERFSIYQNNHDETYDDQAGPTGIGMATRLMSGWGLKFFDSTTMELSTCFSQTEIRMT